MEKTKQVRWAKRRNWKKGHMLTKRTADSFLAPFLRFQLRDDLTARSSLWALASSWNFRTRNKSSFTARFSTIRKTETRWLNQTRRRSSAGRYHFGGRHRHVVAFKSPWRVYCSCGSRSFCVELRKRTITVRSVVLLMICGLWRWEKAHLVRALLLSKRPDWR